MISSMRILPMLSKNSLILLCEFVVILKKTYNLELNCGFSFAMVIAQNESSLAHGAFSCSSVILRT
jgi:hypothetical protein